MGLEQCDRYDSSLERERGRGQLMQGFAVTELLFILNKIGSLLRDFKEGNDIILLRVVTTTPVCTENGL